MIFGMVWYEFEPEPVDEATGWCSAVSPAGTRRPGKKPMSYSTRWIGALGPIRQPKRGQMDHYAALGQECGFILASDSENTMRQAEITPVEFGNQLYFPIQASEDHGLKVFVTTNYSGRIKQFGSAVFSRDGTLLGTVSGVEKDEYDVGHRAVVRTLLGFPKFTTPKLQR